MRRFIKIVLDTDYCGTREEIYMKTNMTDEQLDSYVNDMAIEAEMDEFYEGAGANSFWEEVTEEEAAENEYKTYIVNNWNSRGCITFDTSATCYI